MTRRAPALPAARLWLVVLPAAAGAHDGPPGGTNSLGESVAGPFRVQDLPSTLLLAALGGVGAVALLLAAGRGRRRAARPGAG